MQSCSASPSIVSRARSSSLSSSTSSCSHLMYLSIHSSCSLTTSSSVTKPSVFHINSIDDVDFLSASFSRLPQPLIKSVIVTIKNIPNILKFFKLFFPPILKSKNFKTCFKAPKLIVPIKCIFLLKNYHIPNNIARDTFTLIFSSFR